MKLKTVAKIMGAYFMLNYAGCEGKTEKPAVPEHYKQFFVLMDQRDELNNRFIHECDGQVRKKQPDVKALEGIVAERNKVEDELERVGWNRRKEWRCFYHAFLADGVHYSGPGAYEGSGPGGRWGSMWLKDRQYWQDEKR